MNTDSPGLSVAPSAPFDRGRLTAVLLGNGLLRVANAAGGALVGFYLAELARQGQPVGAGLVGVLGVVSNGTELVGAIPFGVLSDRYSPRALLVVGALVGALATQLFGITGLIAVFYLSRALEGVSVVAGSPALLAHLTDITQRSPALRGRVMSFFELSQLSGLALGGLLGGRLWDATNTTAFSLLATVYFVVAALFFWGANERTWAREQGTGNREQGTGNREQGTGNRVLQDELRVENVERKTQPVSGLAGLRHALADPLLRRLAPAWLAVNMIIGMWLTHIAYQLTAPKVAGQYLVGRFTASEAGLVLLAYALLFAAGAVVWGYLLTYMSRVRVLQIGIGTMLLACLWVYLLNSGGAWADAPFYTVLGLLVVSVAVESGFTPAALAYLADAAGGSPGRGSAMGIYTLLLGLGSALGAGVGGALARWDALNGIVIGTAVLALVSLATLWLLPAEGER